MYKDSCTVTTDRSGITLLSPLIVRRMNIVDIGNGQVRLTAQGSFFASGMAIRSGPTNVVPTAFDGQMIETFASIHDILQAGDLTLVAQNGITQPFAVVRNPAKRNQCSITEASMTAIPHPDGTARVHLTFRLGNQYDLDDNADGQPQPFVMVGGQVYGNQESPFIEYSSCKSSANPSLGPQCDFDFVAQTSALKNAQTFLVRDIAWDDLKKRGTIQFAPSFDKLSISSIYPKPEHRAAGTDTTLFAVAGFEFKKMDLTPTCNDSANSDLRTYCLRAYVGNEYKEGLLQRASDNEATFLLSSAALGKAKAIRFQLASKKDFQNTIPADLSADPNAVEWDLALPKADEAKVSVSPTYMFRGDSQTATVAGNGINLSALKDVLYDGKVYYTPTATNKPSADKLEILISTDVTKTAGRKEFVIELVDAQAKVSTQKFTIDVTLR